VLPGVTAEAARRFGDRAAFVDAEGRPLSFRELDRRSDAVGAALLAAGFEAGDVVALTLPSTTAYVLAYLGAAKAGLVTAGVNPRLAPAEQQACLDLVGPALVLADASEVAALERAGGDAAPPPLPPDPDRDVVVVFTSGTTGTPKGARFTDAQLAAVTRIDVADAWGDGSHLPMLAATQFAHVGFMTKLAWYLRLGATTHLLDRWRAAAVLDLIEREQVPMLGGVAPQLALLLRDPDLGRRDLSCVRQIVMGGGPSSPALVADARRAFGADYSIRYSSTESGGVGTGTAFDAPDAEALHTVGRPRPGVEVAVLDEAGRPVELGAVGEVALRSAATMAGYWHDAPATAEAIRDGWLWTGDLGRIDEAGCLVLAGRRKEMFIRGGYNVYPSEVEAVLEQHPAVDQIAIVPRPDPVMGEIGVAVVVPTDPGAPPSVADLAAFAAERLARFKHPQEVVVVDELPLTPMQKLDRRGLAAMVVRP